MTKMATLEIMPPKGSVTLGEGEFLVPASLPAHQEREKVKDAFINTPFVNIERNWAGVPDNWTGYEPEPVQSLQTLRMIVDYKSCFAREVSMSIEIGDTVLKRGNINHYSLTFPEIIGSGTGEAAAQLVWSTLENAGLKPREPVGRKLFFAAPEHRAQLEEFINLLRGRD